MNGNKKEEKEKKGNLKLGGEGRGERGWLWEELEEGKYDQSILYEILKNTIYKVKTKEGMMMQCCNLSTEGAEA